MAAAYNGLGSACLTTDLADFAQISSNNYSFLKIYSQHGRIRTNLSLFFVTMIFVTVIFKYIKIVSCIPGFCYIVLLMLH